MEKKDHAAYFEHLPMWSIVKTITLTIAGIYLLGEFTQTGFHSGIILIYFVILASIWTEDWKMIRKSPIAFTTFLQQFVLLNLLTLLFIQSSVDTNRIRAFFKFKKEKLHITAGICCDQNLKTSDYSVKFIVDGVEIKSIQLDDLLAEQTQYFDRSFFQGEFLYLEYRNKNNSQSLRTNPIAIQKNKKINAIVSL